MTAPRWTRRFGAHTHGAELAAGVFRLATLFANAYMVDTGDGSWVLVDTGLAWFAGAIRRGAAARFGRPPTSIVLTHGHFDHAGNVEELAAEWGVPVYAHRLELPFLNGRSDYPPADPTVGGLVGLLYRGFPHHGVDLRDRVRRLPEDGSVPGLPGWRAIHTPGDTAGHVSLYREADRTLLAGDAVTTMDLGSTLGLLLGRRVVGGPPAPFTTDWPAAALSIERLAALQPKAVAAGHGRPLRGRRATTQLARLAQIFAPPRRGRYVARPARTDEGGIVELPPAAPDPLPRQLLVAGLTAGALYAVVRTLRARRERAAPRRNDKRKLRK